MLVWFWHQWEAWILPHFCSHFSQTDERLGLLIETKAAPELSKIIPAAVYRHRGRRRRRRGRGATRNWAAGAGGRGRRGTIHGFSTQRHREALILHGSEKRWFYIKQHQITSNNIKEGKLNAEKWVIFMLFLTK